MNLDFFTGETDKPSEHELAWFNQDWQAVKKLADSYKEKEETVLSFYSKQIFYQQDDISVDSDYPRRQLDSIISIHPDCIHYAYMANLCLSKMDNLSHYRYLKTAITPKKRFLKPTKLYEDLHQLFYTKLLMKIYNIGYDSALMYKQIMIAKKTLLPILKMHKGLVTDEFIAAITKNAAEQKELRNLL